MSHRAADLLVPMVQGHEDFTYPNDAFRTLIRHYAKMGDDAMVDLLQHEEARFARIKRKLEHERRMEEET